MDENVAIRNRKMYERRCEGKAFRDIAYEFGVSIARAQQIINDEERQVKRDNQFPEFVEIREKFSTRIVNALFSAGYRTPDEIREATDIRLLAIPNLGPTTVADIRKVLPRKQ